MQSSGEVRSLIRIDAIMSSELLGRLLHILSSQHMRPKYFDDLDDNPPNLRNSLM
jgi:hypothetical protein